MREERWITWIEPWGPNSEPVYSFAPESTAIAFQKSARSSKTNNPYRSDADALDDFMVVNWATFTEKPKGFS